MATQELPPTLSLSRSSVQPALVKTLPEGSKHREPVTAEVASRLLAHLSKHFGVRGLRFLKPPCPVNDGWETNIYHFQLASSAALPKELDRPLTLRLFSSPNNVPSACREAAVHKRVQQSGYPVPDLLGCEQDCTALGGPFFLMEQVQGRTFLYLLLYRPWSICWIPDRMAEALHRLHQLPTSCLPSPRQDLVDRGIAEISATIDELGLDGLARGRDWLVAHRPNSPSDPRLLHLDFHPVNLMQRRDNSYAVLDWTSAAVGDPHADVATTLMLMECLPPPARRKLWSRVLAAIGRRMLCRQFLKGYRRRAELEEQRLHYYGAWAALRRLGKSAHFLQAQRSGAKSSLLPYLKPRHLAKLSRYFFERTGIDADL